MNLLFLPLKVSFNLFLYMSLVLRNTTRKVLLILLLLIWLVHLWQILFQTTMENLLLLWLYLLLVKILKCRSTIFWLLFIVVMELVLEDVIVEGILPMFNANYASRPGTVLLSVITDLITVFNLPLQVIFTLIIKDIQISLVKDIFVHSINNNNLFLHLINTYLPTIVLPHLIFPLHNILLMLWF